MRAAACLAAFAFAGALAGCGDDPALPSGPESSEEQVLRDAAEMLPPEATATPSASATPAAN